MVPKYSLKTILNVVQLLSNNLVNPPAQWILVINRPSTDLKALEITWFYDAIVHVNLHTAHYLIKQAPVNIIYFFAAISETPFLGMGTYFESHFVKQHKARI